MNIFQTNRNREKTSDTLFNSTVCLWNLLSLYRNKNTNAMIANTKTANLKRELPSNIEIRDLTEIKKSPGIFSGPFRATLYQLVWISSGEVTIFADFRDIVLKAGEAILISVNQVYGFSTTSDFQGRMISFAHTFFSRTETDCLFLHNADILNPLALNQVIRFPSHYMEALPEFLATELMQPNDPFQPDIIYHYLSAILLEAERYITQVKEDKHSFKERSLARTFVNEVELHFKSSKQVDFYIRKLDVYEKTLAREVKAFTGKTPKQYIEARLILEAKRLLIYSSLTATDICFDLGWDEATNFNKFFRKHTGLTPLEFRKKNVLLKHKMAGENPTTNLFV